MKKRQILWAIVFGSMLAITGCGDSGSSSPAGSGGTAGSRGSAGANGGGSSVSSCEAICSSTCAFEGVDPGDLDYDTCVSECKTGVPQFDDDCGPQLDALLDCLEANGCNEETLNCNSQGIAWATCFSGVSLP